MLVKASTVIGLPVFTLHDGKKIDVIKDLLYHPKQNRIAAFLVDAGGLFSEAKVIVYEDISSIGEDAVLVASIELLKKASSVQHDIESIAKGQTYLTGVKILTETGVMLGMVSDIYFNTDTGIVEEFEVTQGDIRNPYALRRRVKISDIITLGEDVTIVKVPADYHTYTERKPESGGIMRAIHNMRQAVKQHLENLTGSSEQKQEAVDEAPKIEDKPEEVETTEQVSTSDNTETIPEDQKQAIIGLYLTKNILASDDTILAEEGDIVTHKLLEEAENAGVLHEVINNVTHHVQLTS